MTQEQICKVCNMAAVEGCPNTLEQKAGAAILRFIGEDIYSDVCPNMKIVALRQRLLRIDPQFAGVDHDPTTPLYQRGKLDRTTKNLLLTQTDWVTFLSHFKWVIGCKDPKFFPRVVTDMTLKQVYMGEASVRSRLPDQREDDSLLTYNSLEDLLASPDLVIIRVGFVVYFNRAMASILLEALMVRDGRGKPTWIVEETGQEFKPYVKDDYGNARGMPCCNDDVLRFVEARFESLQLGDGSSQAEVEVHEDGVAVGPSPEAEEERTHFEPEAAESEAPEEAELDPEDELINDLTKRPQRKRWR